MNTYQKKKYRFILSIFLLGAGVVYAVWPFDIIPDLLVPIGWIDDIGVLIASVLFAGVSFYRMKKAQNKLI